MEMATNEENAPSEKEEVKNDDRKDESKSPAVEAETELETCRKEVQRLSAIIDNIKREAREAQAFAELFPEVKADEIPDCVKKQAETEGIPVVAAYAIYDRRRTLERKKCSEILERSAARSSGMIAGGAVQEDYFTVDQIRMMSPREVRKHYKAIMKSLSKGKN